MATLPQDSPDDRVDLGVLSAFAGYHLRRASSVFAADFARALDGTGMRQVLFGILSVVAANPDINQGAVGRALGIQRANMVALINELVEQALIERCVSPGDRRASALRLRPEGQTRLDECKARIRVHEDEMLLGLSVSDRKVLIALLMRIEAKERG